MSKEIAEGVFECGVCMNEFKLGQKRGCPGASPCTYVMCAECAERCDRCPQCRAQPTVIRSTGFSTGLESVSLWCLNNGLLQVEWQ